MALSGKHSEIPQNAIILSEKEALQAQIKLIEQWKPTSDVWPLRYGFGILATVSGISALYINSHYRQKVRLGSYASISTYLPTVVIPTLTSGLLHYEAVTTQILLLKKCPACHEIRAALIQSFLGVVFPLIAAPLAAFNFAFSYNTYRIPWITQEPREAFKLLKRFTKPIKSILYYNLIFQIVLSMGITYLEVNSFLNVHEKLMNLENSSEKELKV